MCELIAVAPKEKVCSKNTAIIVDTKTTKKTKINKRNVYVTFN